MAGSQQDTVLGHIDRIYREAAASDDGERCMVAPAPELQDRIVEQLERAAEQVDVLPAATFAAAGTDRVGFNDGLIIPGKYFPLGTPPSTVRAAAADRGPLHGTLRVIVVLVEFSDRQMTESAAHFTELFFSLGTMAGGSVRDFFREASHGLVDIQGQVVGPYQLPQTLATYANGASGTGGTLPNARTMAADAAAAADPHVDFGPYDNDANGYVDAFVVVHAGPGAEVTGSTGDIWSHKWVLPTERVSDSTKIYGYLTIPEDARIGVSAHELGHLLFGWPDLYDTDYSSNGIGNWCLMAGGSWNDGGNTPAHPSAWCKTTQGWVTVANQTSNATVSIADVKSTHTVHRLWKDGGASGEYFLVENRQKTGFDAHLPEGGLLIWHVDESIGGNQDENHPKVALEQADGQRHLETRANRGDAGDCYPGSADRRTFDKDSTPSSKSYAGVNTCVAVDQISDAGATMSARLHVRCHIVKPKEVKLEKNELKLEKLEKFEAKDRLTKELRYEKTIRTDKKPEKPVIDKSVQYDKPFDKPGDKTVEGRPGGGLAHGEPSTGALQELEARVAALEATLGGAQPFIGQGLRPDLSAGAYLEEADAPSSGPERIDDVFEKRLLDAPPTGG